MANTFDDLFDSVEKSPSYWMQVAILEFLQTLQATRAAKGVLSNKELADLVGVSSPTLSRWLNGNENLTISTMCRLATALGAAVHIHVADKAIKGRWRAEPGELTRTLNVVKVDFSDSSNRKRARSARAQGDRSVVLNPRIDLEEAYG